MKVAVIGAGAFGTAAARFLAKGGHDVTVFEQFALGHDRGSSHGTSRIIRKTYPDAYYTALMNEAYPMWLDLQREYGRQIFTETGFLIFGRPGESWLQAARASLMANRVSFEEMGPIDVARRFGGFHLEPDEAAMFQFEAGVVRADEALRANVAIAQAHGARFVEHTRAEPRPNGEVNGERFDAVVVCAGSWINRFAPLGLETRIQTFAYFDAPIRGTLPAWVEATPTHDYGFPNYGRGFKVGRHEYGPTINPDTGVREADERALKGITETARLRLGAQGGPLESHTCLYTVAPNEDFRMGRLPWKIPAYFVSACSGHGFKFSLWFGKLICDMVDGRKRPEDFERFYVEVRDE